MKSGLKVSESLKSVCPTVCSNHCRDEKRTESQQCFVIHKRQPSVATIAAMKSGLKVGVLPVKSSHCIKSSNHCRDEKRTESWYLCYRLMVLPFSSNHCRDEKRTESCHGYRVRQNYRVATIAAMKSGLKDACRCSTGILSK